MKLTKEDLKLKRLYEVLIAYDESCGRREFGALKNSRKDMLINKYTR